MNNPASSFSIPLFCICVKSIQGHTKNPLISISTSWIPHLSCFGKHYYCVSCYFTDHSKSLDLTINFSSSTFDNGHLKATVLVCSLYLGLAPDPCRVPPLFSFLFLVFIYKLTIKVFKFVPSCHCHIFNFIFFFAFFYNSCFTKN